MPNDLCDILWVGFEFLIDFCSICLFAVTFSFYFQFSHSVYNVVEAIVTKPQTLPLAVNFYFTEMLGTQNHCVAKFSGVTYIVFALDTSIPTLSEAVIQVM